MVINTYLNINLTDEAGFSSNISRWFYIDNIYPMIYTTMPEYNGTIQFSNTYQIKGFVNGTGTNISAVSINESRFTLSINPSGNPWGNFSFVNNTALPDGVITLKLSVNDSGGLTSNLTINFRVLQFSNNTALDIYANRENFVYGTDSQGNIIVELYIFVSSDTNITITSYTKNPIGISLKGSLGFFEFTLGNQTALINATMRLYYNQSELGNIKEEDLRIYNYNNSIWSELNSTVNTIDNYLEWFTTSLSYYAIAPKMTLKPKLLLALPSEELPNLVYIFILIGAIAASIIVASTLILRKRSSKSKTKKGTFRKHKKKVGLRPDENEKMIAKFKEIKKFKKISLEDFKYLITGPLFFISKDLISRIKNLKNLSEQEKELLIRDLATINHEKREEWLKEVEELE